MQPVLPGGCQQRAFDRDRGSFRTIPAVGGIIVAGNIRIVTKLATAIAPWPPIVRKPPRSRAPVGSRAARPRKGARIASPWAQSPASGQGNPRVHPRERGFILHEQGPSASGQSVLAAALARRLPALRHSARRRSRSGRTQAQGPHPTETTGSRDYAQDDELGLHTWACAG